MEKMRNTLRAVMLGSAIGDALGVPVEFTSREKRRLDPVTDYRGYGSHMVPAGTWSDDTSMALATLDSLTRGLDYRDMMARFLAWMEEGEYTATGEVFDMGGTVRYALNRFAAGTAPRKCGGKGVNDNGNGSLMRIHPAVLYGYCRMPREAAGERMALVWNVSRLTHAHPRALTGCGIYSCVLEALLEDLAPASVEKGLCKARELFREEREYPHYQRLLTPGFAALPEGEIKSTGYVVDTLEAALWCLLTTESFSDCVLKAVNLGGDTDTVAAVAGGLAGALYGLDAIPADWYRRLLCHERIDALCEKFCEK